MSNFSCYPCGNSSRGCGNGRCPTGPTGPTGTAGPAAATIPFSVNSYGTEFSTDALGSPSTVMFAGFSANNEYATHLEPGEWDSGVILGREDTFLGSMFVMPRTSVLKTIQVMFATKQGSDIPQGVTVRPFVALATTTTNRLIFNVLQDTITYTEPYIGGVDYPKHTLRKGALSNINVTIPEGAIVAIIAGIRADNTTEEQEGMFTVGGGLYLE